MYRHQGRVAILSVSLAAVAGGCAADGAGPTRRPRTSATTPTPGTAPGGTATGAAGGGAVFGNPGGELPQDSCGAQPIGEEPGPSVNLQCQQQDCGPQP